MKLISMIDFILSDKVKSALEYEESYKIIRSYTNFLKQHLKLEMFVPCNDEGSVLEPPIYTTNHSDECYCKECEEETKRCSDLQGQYQKAKEKVLFEGFHIEGNKLCYSDFYFGTIYDISNLKVENLLSELPENEMPKLTLSAIKQIGL